VSMQSWDLRPEALKIPMTASTPRGSVRPRLRGRCCDQGTTWTPSWRATHSHYVICWSSSTVKRMALPTKGRVIIHTTAGELDIELWSKVCYLHRPSVVGSEDVTLLRKPPKPAGTSSRLLWKVCESITQPSGNSYGIVIKGYYDGVNFHRYATVQNPCTVRDTLTCYFEDRAKFPCADWRQDRYRCRRRVILRR